MKQSPPKTAFAARSERYQGWPIWLAIIAAASLGAASPVAEDKSKMTEDPKTPVFEAERISNYRGPSLRCERKMESGVTSVDFRNTSQNEENIDRILSAYQIPFHIEQPSDGWWGAETRLLLTVSEESRDAAFAILQGAAAAGLVEVVEGTTGLFSR